MRFRRLARQDERPLGHDILDSGAHGDLRHQCGRTDHSIPGGVLTDDKERQQLSNTWYDLGSRPLEPLGLQSSVLLTDRTDRAEQ